jgi:hypothetical protein
MIFVLVGVTISLVPRSFGIAIPSGALPAQAIANPFEGGPSIQLNQNRARTK